LNTKKAGSPSKRDAVKRFDDYSMIKKDKPQARFRFSCLNQTMRSTSRRASSPTTHCCRKSVGAIFSFKRQSKRTGL